MKLKALSMLEVNWYLGIFSLLPLGEMALSVYCSVAHLNSVIIPYSTVCYNTTIQVPHALKDSTIRALRNEER